MATIKLFRTPFSHGENKSFLFKSEANKDFTADFETQFLLGTLPESHLFLASDTTAIFNCPIINDYKSANYLEHIIGTESKYYWVVGSKQVNEKTIQLELELDPITTYMQDLTLKNGYELKRGHMKDFEDVNGYPFLNNVGGNGLYTNEEQADLPKFVKSVKEIKKYPNLEYFGSLESMRLWKLWDMSAPKGGVKVYLSDNFKGTNPNVATKPNITTQGLSFIPVIRPYAQQGVSVSYKYFDKGTMKTDTYIPYDTYSTYYSQTSTEVVIPTILGVVNNEVPYDLINLLENERKNDHIVGAIQVPFMPPFHFIGLQDQLTNPVGNKLSKVFAFSVDTAVSSIRPFTIEIPLDPPVVSNPTLPLQKRDSKYMPKLNYGPQYHSFNLMGADGIPQNFSYFDMIESQTSATAYMGLDIDPTGFTQVITFKSGNYADNGATYRNKVFIKMNTTAPLKTTAWTDYIKSHQTQYALAKAQMKENYQFNRTKSFVDIGMGAITGAVGGITSALTGGMGGAIGTQIGLGGISSGIGSGLNVKQLDMNYKQQTQMLNAQQTDMKNSISYHSYGSDYYMSLDSFKYLGDSGLLMFEEEIGADMKAKIYNKFFQYGYVQNRYVEAFGKKLHELLPKARFSYIEAEGMHQCLSALHMPTAVLRQIGTLFSQGVQIWTPRNATDLTLLNDYSIENPDTEIIN